MDSTQQIVVKRVRFESFTDRLHASVFVHIDNSMVDRERAETPSGLVFSRGPVRFRPLAPLK